jgi:hypothetical protein
MTAAFDLACRSVPVSRNGNDDVRRELALAILRCVSQEERNAARLARLAFGEFSSPLQPDDRWRRSYEQRQPIDLASPTEIPSLGLAAA